MKKRRRVRVACCTCGARGPWCRTRRAAITTALDAGWEWCLSLWRCPRCVERGRLPDVRVGLGPIAAAGVRIFPDDPTMN